jgi:hypothetical protein
LNKLLLIAALGAAVGCSADEPPPATGSIWCLDDSDCTSGFACDAWTGMCACASSAVCEEGQVCNPYSGMCEEHPERCASDAACAAAEYCAEDGTCHQRKGLCEPCDSSASCGGAGDLCLPSGACGVDCEVDPDGCPPGAVCWRFPGAQQCVPAFGDCSVPPRCRGDADCPPGNTCREGACVGTCQNDSQCAAGWRCADNLCRPPARCPDDSDDECPAGTVCRAGRCMPGCLDSTDCPLGSRCRVGRCASGCDTRADCPLDRACIDEECVDEVCSQGPCEPACQVDLFCPAGRFCDVAAGHCRDGLPGGLCNACDRLQPGGCAGGLCVGHATRIGCTGHQQCDGGTYCDARFSCFFDRDCAGGQQCDGADLNADIPGVCSGGNCSGFRCASPCDGAAGSCPTGFVCSPVQRPGGGVVGHYCLADQGQLCE